MLQRSYVQSIYRKENAMQGLLRIKNYPSVQSLGGNLALVQSVKPGTNSQPAAPPQSDDYLSRLVKLLPAPVVTLYLFGSNIIPTTSQLGKISLTIWSITCLGLVILATAVFTAAPEVSKGPDWIHVAVAAVSFIIWLYALGGPFMALQPQIVVGFIASLLVAGWTFIVPYFYKGPVTNLS
jgi:hypothetical protein